MTFSIPIRFPIRFPNVALGRPGPFVTHHRDTEAQSHRTVASAKARRHKEIAKSSHSNPWQFQSGGQRGECSSVKNASPHREMVSVFLCAPLCLCGEKPTIAPEIGAVQ